MRRQELIDELTKQARRQFPGLWVAVWTSNPAYICADTTCSAQSLTELLVHLSGHHDWQYATLIVPPDRSFLPHGTHHTE